jgi:hypothetical protein
LNKLGLQALKTVQEAAQKYKTLRDSVDLAEGKEEKISITSTKTRFFFSLKISCWQVNLNQFLPTHYLTSV